MNHIHVLFINNNILPSPWRMKKFLLEIAQLTWLLYNQMIFILTCLYYHILSLIEETTVTNGQFPEADLRIPKHIALCFTNEIDYLDIDSISRIICWCKQMNIRCITLYDEPGKLKCKQKELIKLFERRMRLLGSEKPIDHIEGLNILSRSDGRPKFIEHVKELLQLETDNINLEQVDKQVGWTSDPEMLINFGLPLCLYGFPPWPLRLTEIYHIPTHRRVPHRVFVDILRRYSRTVQRVGT